MQPRRSSPVLHAAVVAMGLMAGLFFAWDVSVMPGLARLDDGAFVTAMQILIVAIENPVFYSVLTGALVFPAVAAVLLRRRGQRVASWWTLAALALYVVAIGVTTAVHFPLNDTLVAAGDVGRIADLAALRLGFEQPWVTANIVRTVTCALALLCLARALSLDGRPAVPARRAA